MPSRLLEGRQGSEEGAADRWGVWSAGAEVDTIRGWKARGAPAPRRPRSSRR